MGVMGGRRVGHKEPAQPVEQVVGREPVCRPHTRRLRTTLGHPAVEVVDVAAVVPVLHPS